MIKISEAIERQLLFKERRVEFWERHHRIPTIKDLLKENEKRREVRV